VIDTTEAVRLAAEVTRELIIGYVGFDAGLPMTIQADEVATAAVTAALPALAEQFAALIEAEALKFERSAQFESHSRRTQLLGHASGLGHAARLVREAVEVTE
jgi:hypothetical protein